VAASSGNLTEKLISSVDFENITIFVEKTGKGMFACQ
jgi:hypothetical protein